MEVRRENRDIVIKEGKEKKVMWERVRGGATGEEKIFKEKEGVQKLKKVTKKSLHQLMKT